jgi:creatinine amidohydrolase
MAIWFEMSEMTSPEFKAALQTVRVALIPVGATEQHGPNLGLGTDYVVGHRLARRLAERLHPRAVVVPPLPFGVSPHHMGFAGTISLSAEAFLAVGFDIGKSLQTNGIRHLLFVNGHAGNVAILNVLTTKLHYELGVQAASSFYFAQAADKVKAHGKTARYGHACEIESSVVLALAPELARPEAFEPGDMIATERKFSFNNQTHFLQVPIPFHEQTRNGAFGDARLATVAVGEEVIGAAVERTLEFLDGFLAT